MNPYYQRAGVTLYLGQAEEVAPTLSEPGIVILDPPYSAHVHTRARTSKGANGRNISASANFGFTHLTSRGRRALAAQAARLASRWVLVFSDIESAWLWRLSLRAAGLRYLRTPLWTRSGAPQFSGDCPAVGAEAITLAHAAVKGRRRWNGGGKAGVYDIPIVPSNGIREPRIHTTQKPERLMIALVDDFSSPGELVYDFTAGSCTTGIACLRGAKGARRFVGIERDEQWLEKAAKRLDAELSGVGYLAAQAGQLGLLDVRRTPLRAEAGVA